MQDDELRGAAFLELGRLGAIHGPAIPYRGGLESGFSFQGHRIPFLTPYKGIYRARAQEGPAALSINTSYDSPYRDRATSDGYVYSYRSGSVDQPDNRALRAACELQAPIIYFVPIQPGIYEPLFPWYVDSDDPIEREVSVTPGQVVRIGVEERAAPLDSLIERQYEFRTTRIRVHQRRFRSAVLPAYRNRCAICRLREGQLLDAAHITPDREEDGQPVVSNGLSLCSIHHRAFDQDLVGVTPALEVQVSRRLLDDEDGPMLDVLKGFHGATIDAPTQRALRPDRERLALRFERFCAAG
jgi:putative restriction endonuclease